MRSRRWRRRWVEASPGDKPKHLEISAPLLAAGQQLEARFGEDLGAPLRPFIAEAIKAEAAERERKTRRTRITVVVSVVVAVAMAVLAAWAFSQRSEAIAQQAEAEKQRASAVKNEEEANRQKAAAEQNLALATDAANSLVFDIAQKIPRRLRSPRVADQERSRARKRSPAEIAQHAANWAPIFCGARRQRLRRRATTLLTVGDTNGALKTARKASSVFESLLKQQPDSADYQRDLSVSYDNIGDVKTAQGDLAGALKAYQDSLAIVDRLAKSDPGNAGWQRDLSVSYEQDRRREDGAGRPCGRAEGLSGQPRDRRPAGEIRSRQRRLAARSFGVV